mmetsp:Transcript_65889/g.182613  ORF Transcript_65889/g.182613 Transcript_65889/m.182613 type:complete len:358 (-) Transcript_65889:605-1678(-)
MHPARQSSGKARRPPTPWISPATTAQPLCPASTSSPGLPSRAATAASQVSCGGGRKSTLAPSRPQAAIPRAARTPAPLEAKRPPVSGVIVASKWCRHTQERATSPPNAPAACQRILRSCKGCLAVIAKASRPCAAKPPTARPRRRCQPSKPMSREIVTHTVTGTVNNSFDSRSGARPSLTASELTTTAVAVLTATRKSQEYSRGPCHTVTAPRSNAAAAMPRWWRSGASRSAGPRLPSRRRGEAATASAALRLKAPLARTSAVVVVVVVAVLLVRATAEVSVLVVGAVVVEVGVVAVEVVAVKSFVVVSLVVVLVAAVADVVVADVPVMVVAVVVTSCVLRAALLPLEAISPGQPRL